jgi:hypothetical protein
MRITVTGFDLESREQLQQLIQRAGGEYLPSLAQNVTTHLIALVLFEFIHFVSFIFRATEFEVSFF